MCLKMVPVLHGWFPFGFHLKTQRQPRRTTHPYLEALPDHPMFRYWLGRYGPVWSFYSTSSLGSHAAQTAHKKMLDGTSGHLVAPFSGFCFLPADGSLAYVSKAPIRPATPPNPNTRTNQPTNQQTNKQARKHARARDRERERERERKRERERERERKREREREKEIETRTQAHKHRSAQIHKHTGAQTHAHRQRHIHTHTQFGKRTAQSLCNRRLK